MVAYSYHTGRQFLKFSKEIHRRLHPFESGPEPVPGPELSSKAVHKAVMQLTSKTQNSGLGLGLGPGLERDAGMALEFFLKK
jgi:hypothetical protein